ncbi:MAG: hypothetical protein HYU36_07915 [Planctomycetes bacterium]|nr:hypothetical protein [Planctomycetota bacterium]
MRGWVTVSGRCWRSPDRRAAACGLVVLLGMVGFAPNAFGWGEGGHILIARTAAAKLPRSLPAFLRDEGDLLGYLCIQPDRWKHTAGELRAVEAANHFLDMENLPPAIPGGPVYPATRIDFLIQIGESKQKVDAVGLLPYQVLEYFLRLKGAFMEYRWAQEDPKGKQARSPLTRGSMRSVELNALHYAGILAHYAGDAAQPLHASIFYDGRGADGQPAKTGVHYRFEIDLVRDFVDPESLPGLVGRPRVLKDLLGETHRILAESNALVGPLLDLDEKGKVASGDPAASSLARKRLAAGSQFLLDLWYTAWVQSERDLAAYQATFKVGAE